MLALIQEGMFDIVVEARRDNPVEAFTEQVVREYKRYLKFCVLKNRCLFVTKETSRTNPPPANVHGTFLVTKSICQSSLREGRLIFEINWNL